MKCLYIILAVFLAVGTSLVGAGSVQAQVTDDCSKREPPFPNQDSSQVMREVETVKGEFPIRRGFYCVPASAAGSITMEYEFAFGFGYDKARYRHGITKIKIIEFPMKYDKRPEENNDGHYNFKATTRKMECETWGTECRVIERAPVVAVVSPKGMSEYYGMPAGDPVGLLTFYCQNSDPYNMKCPDWVNTALDIFK